MLSMSCKSAASARRSTPRRDANDVELHWQVDGARICFSPIRVLIETNCDGPKIYEFHMKRDFTREINRRLDAKLQQGNSKFGAFDYDFGGSVERGGVRLE